MGSYAELYGIIKTMDWQNYLYPFLVLLGIVVLIFGIAWFLRRLQHPQLVQRSRQKKIAILEIRPIDQKTKILEILWENERLLLATNDHSLLLLSHKKASLEEGTT